MMKKSTLISLVALAVALVGALIALVAYLKRSRCVLCEDFEEEDMSDIDLDIADYNIPVSDLEDDFSEEEAAACPASCEECTETCCAQEEIAPDAVVEEEKSE